MAEQLFEYDADGTKHACSFEVTGGKHSIVKVKTPWGSKATQKVGSPAAAIARMMAGELYRNYRRLH